MNIISKKQFKPNCIFNSGCSSFFTEFLKNSNLKFKNEI